MDRRPVAKWAIALVVRSAAQMPRQCHRRRQRRPPSPHLRTTIPSASRTGSMMMTVAPCKKKRSARMAIGWSSVECAPHGAAGPITRFCAILPLQALLRCRSQNSGRAQWMAQGRHAAARAPWTTPPATICFPNKALPKIARRSACKSQGARALSTRRLADARCGSDRAASKPPRMRQAIHACAMSQQPRHPHSTWLMEGRTEHVVVQPLLTILPHTTPYSIKSTLSKIARLYASSSRNAKVSSIHKRVGVRCGHAQAEFKPRKQLQATPAIATSPSQLWGKQRSLCVSISS
mmetsp:Transcript_26993/g.81321  ORF Transcript_26993/g.81321 Transcript_26993/m.81321 type:complete len:292 (-) Transcript_26993:319-1194(-)